MKKEQTEQQKKREARLKAEADKANKNLKKVEEARKKNGLPPLVFGREPKAILPKVRGK